MTIPIYQGEEWQCRYVFADSRCCGLRKNHEGDHVPASGAAPAEPLTDAADRAQRWLKWQDDPQWEKCPRCDGRGYHHGFGERGVDPDWCLDCGGPGEVPTEEGTWAPEDIVRELLAAHATQQAALRRLKRYAMLDATKKPTRALLIDGAGHDPNLRHTTRADLDQWVKWSDVAQLLGEPGDGQ